MNFKDEKPMETESPSNDVRNSTDHATHRATCKDRCLQTLCFALSKASTAKAHEGVDAADALDKCGNGRGRAYHACL